MLCDILSSYGASEVSAMELYTDVFRLGEGFIQRSDECPSDPSESKANPIVLGPFDGRVYRRILFEDTFEETLVEFQQADWAITNGVTYWGRRNTGEAQSRMFAMIFDLDGQDDAKLTNFLAGAHGERGFQWYPLPQYVVLSGRNVHLYYVLEEPVDLYPAVKTQLKNLKYALSDRIWNRYTSNDEHVQHQGINQGFRIVGGRTKDGGTVRAFRLDAHPTTVGELNGFVDEAHRVDLSAHVTRGPRTLAEAARLWPEWYGRAVVDGTLGERRYWHYKEDLYEWWLRRVRDPSSGATMGHRYFCLMGVAIFAVKCGITDRERVRADMEALVPVFDSIPGSAPFGGDHEVDNALECFDARYTTFPRRDLERITAVDMPPNKRNWRPQTQHMAVMRAIQNVTDPDGSWRNKDGAPKKRDLIRDYAREHPGMSQRAIAKALGVSPATVNKWLKDA